MSNKKVQIICLIAGNEQEMSKMSDDQFERDGRTFLWMAILTTFFIKFLWTSSFWTNDLAKYYI